MEYQDGVLEAIYFDEGRLYFGAGNPRFEYHLKDHLGNTRITFADLDGGGSVDASEILQEHHYYPFGMEMEGDWKYHPGRESAYQYNGKELNEDLGLNWLDYGARWYDPAIGRWNAVDPLAEEYMPISSYSYVANNPLLYIDPDGQRIDISQLLTDEDGNLSQEGLNTLMNIITDLKEITGLDLTYKNGFLVETEESSNTRMDLFESGSFLARHFVRGMIIDDQTLTIGLNKSEDHESHVDLDNASNHINFDPAQAFAMGETLKSAGINPLTYGFGMQFLHESVHTKLGHEVLGREDDFPYFVDTKGITTGKTVDVINSFRKQLRIPTRVWYPWVPTTSGYVVPWQVKGSSKAGQIRIYESTYLNYKSKYKK